MKIVQGFTLPYGLSFWPLAFTYDLFILDCCLALRLFCISFCCGGMCCVGCLGLFVVVHCFFYRVLFVLVLCRFVSLFPFPILPSLGFVLSCLLVPFLLFLSLLLLCCPNTNHNLNSKRLPNRKPKQRHLSIPLYKPQLLLYKPDSNPIPSHYPRSHGEQHWAGERQIHTNISYCTVVATASPTFTWNR